MGVESEVYETVELLAEEVLSISEPFYKLLTRSWMFQSGVLAPV